MPISQQNLTARLKNSKSLSELRNQANEHYSIMSAVHDSVICVSCGRFGSNDVRMRVQCRDFYLISADMWLKRHEKSFGREARAVANILQAGAKSSLILSSSWDEELVGGGITYHWTRCRIIRLKIRIRVSFRIRIRIMIRNRIRSNIRIIVLVRIKHQDQD
jgi:hypothetical protein